MSEHSNLEEVVEKYFKELLPDKKTQELALKLFNAYRTSGRKGVEEVIKKLLGDIVED